MFSRQLTVLGLLLFFTVSCSYFFKGEPKKSNVYELSFSEKSGVSCVKDNGKLLREYFDVQRDDSEMASELVKMKKCLKDAVKLFVEHTQGAKKGSYTPQEIHDFLVLAFDSYEYSIQFMEEAFLLKQSLLGGDVETVSKEDVRKLLLYIDYVYDSLATLAPDRRMLFAKDQSTDLEGFEASGIRLQKVISIFRNLPRKSTGTFEYNGFIRLIKYFLSQDADTNHWNRTFEIVNSLQAMLSVGQEGTLEIQKLPDVLNNLSFLYLGYMQFHKFISDEHVFKKDISTIFTFPGLVARMTKHPNVFTNDKINALTKTQDKILKGVKNALQQAPAQKIPLRYIQDFIVTLERTDCFIDSGLKADTLRQMVPQLFGRWLTEQECRGSCDLQFLNIENVDVLKRVIAQWQERQQWINTNAQGFNGSKTAFVNSQYRQRTRRGPVVDNLIRVLSRVGHVHWEDYVVIGEANVNYKDLVIFNSIYTLAELFVRPFNGNGQKNNLVDYYLNPQQAQEFYQWLRPLALDLKLGDPRSRTSGKQALTEINLFGSQSNEPEKMNFSEAVEYFEIAISTGLKSDNIMQNHFGECRDTNAPLDVFGYHRFESECVRSAFAKQHEEVMLSSLPRLIKYLANDPRADRELYLNYLEKAGRQGLIVNEPFETDAFRMMGSISQYAESLFLRFDRDQNDILTVEEFNVGLKHIVPNIREIIKGGLSESEAKTLYSYFPDFEENLIQFIFIKKSIPSLLTAQTEAGKGIGLGQIAAFKKQLEWFPGQLQRLEATREDVLLVISSLSSFARSNRLKAFNNLFFEHELVFEKGLKNISPSDADRQLILSELSRLAQCSEKVEAKLQDWILVNQEKYWNEIIEFNVNSSEWNFFGWKPFKEDMKITDMTDRPQTATSAGWQAKVTAKFIELLFKDPDLGPLCSLPYLEEVHRISADQGPASGEEDASRSATQ